MLPIINSRKDLDVITDIAILRIILNNINVSGLFHIFNFDSYEAFTDYAAEKGVSLSTPEPVIVVPSIPSAEQLRDKAKVCRDTLLSEGFLFQGKVIQTRNQTDINNINGAALRAVSDTTFTTGWITTDNTVLPLDASGIIAMQAAMIARGNDVFTAYIAKCTEIAKATEQERSTLIAEFAV